MRTPSEQGTDFAYGQPSGSAEEHMAAGIALLYLESNDLVIVAPALTECRVVLYGNVCGRLCTG